jgi:hypothetical protein
MQVGAKGMSNGVKMCQHANVSKFMYSFRLGTFLKHVEILMIHKM